MKITRAQFKKAAEIILTRGFNPWAYAPAKDGVCIVGAVAIARGEPIRCLADGSIPYTSTDPIENALSGEEMGVTYWAYKASQFEAAMALLFFAEAAEDE